MTDLAIETHGLGKSFGDRAALTSIDLAVPRGCAFGFLGPNGAGKTTLIRLLLGLARPTSGRMRLLGHDLPNGRAEALSRVGAIIEEPRFHRYTTGRENLCPFAKFTGRDVDGGYAEWAVADERFCFPIPDGYPALQAAPLLCAGLIGHRAYRMCGDARRIGVFGFGAAGHVLCQVARHEVCAVTSGALMDGSAMLLTADR